MIRLCLLGTVELQAADGRSVQSILAQPRRTALLAYLALARPHGFQRRDVVAARFWPEMDAERARAALRGGLHFVRQSLGDDVVLGRGQEEVELNRARVWCDAVAFEAALDGGRPDEAMALYRGELLEGFHLDDAGTLAEIARLDRECDYLADPHTAIGVSQDNKKIFETAAVRANLRVVENHHFDLRLEEGGEIAKRSCRRLDPCGDERLDQAERSPGLFAPGFDHDRNFQRDRGEPK